MLLLFLFRHDVHGAEGVVAFLSHLYLHRYAFLQFLHMADDAHMAARLSAK